MRNTALPLLAFVALNVGSTGQAQTRGAWEKFSNVENTRHWSVNWFATGQLFDPLWLEDISTPGSEASFIYTVFPEQGGGLTISNFRGPTRPADYLSGNLSQQRAAGYSFDLLIENPAGISSIDTSFYSVTTGRYYFSPPIPVEGGVTSVTRLFFGSPWKVFVSGTGYVDAVVPPSALNEVNDFVIRFWAKNPTTHDISGLLGVDNFKVIPEAVVPQLATSVVGSQFTVAFDRWKAQSYTLQRSLLTESLPAFENVEGSTGVTGEGPFSFSVAMTEPKDFFRVSTEVQGIPIGNLGNPAGWTPPTP